MTTRRTVLNVEQLGARVLPSATVAIPAPTAVHASTPVQPTAAWAGQGRYTITTNTTTDAKTYKFQGSTAVNSSGFFAISGTITTVGNKAGQATGRIVLSDPRGTLTLSVTGPTQSAKAALPATFTYKVVSGTGFFAHYSGHATLKLTAPLFFGYDDAGHFQVSATARAGVVPPPPPPPITGGTTTTGPSWAGQGRYSIAVNTTTHAKSYSFQGSAEFGGSNFFAISGTLQTVGSKAGDATGKITLSNPHGTLVLAVTGPAQAANAGLPAKMTYKVVGGTGYFAHFVGQGTFQISTPLFIGYDDRGQFSVAVKPTSK